MSELFGRALARQHAPLTTAERDFFGGDAVNTNERDLADALALQCCVSSVFKSREIKNWMCLPNAKECASAFVCQ